MVWPYWQWNRGFYIKSRKISVYFKSKKEILYDRFVDLNILGAARLVHSGSTNLSNFVFSPIHITAQAPYEISRSWFNVGLSSAKEAVKRGDGHRYIMQVSSENRKCSNINDIHKLIQHIVTLIRWAIDINIAPPNDKFKENCINKNIQI